MDEITEQIDECIARGDYARAATLAESVLAQIPVTAFHKIIGRDLTNLSEEAANHVTEFFEGAKRSLDVKAMYLEMNGFAINPDMWFFAAFAFSFCGNPEYADDTDWLADYEFTPETVFPITGYEDLQDACKDHMENRRYGDKVQREALNAFERIVTIRFIELLDHAVQFAKDKNLSWKDIAVFGTAHDETLLYRSLR
jgi:hypothetical protein